ncbi:MAG: hypothetical protein SGPRY_015027, partial [Prymnesium sp.]
ISSEAYISSVVIYGRSDCCQQNLAHYQVWVTSAPGNPSLLSTGAQRCEPSAYLVAPATVGPFTVTCGLIGSYVTLYLPGSSRFLMVDELIAQGYILLAPPAPPTEPPAPTPPPTPAPIGQLTVVNSSMSSIFSDIRFPGHDFSGTSAHDGVWGGGQSLWSFAHTTRENSPWLSLQMSSEAYISSVVIYGRSDCCQQNLAYYEVWVNAVPGNPTLLSSGAQRCQPTTFLLAPATVGPFTVTCGLTGLYVTLYLPGSSRVLMIDEMIANGYPIQ